MKSIKSILSLVIITLTLIVAVSACKNCCKKDGECKDKKECCNKPCCDKCSDACTAENKCCDKCKKVEKDVCCAKKEGSTDTTAAVTTTEKTCCKEATAPCCEKCEGTCTPENKCCDKCEA